MHDGRKEKRRKMSSYGNHVQNICVFSSLSLELSLQRGFVGSAKALQFGLFRLLLSSSSLSLFLSLSLFQDTSHAKTRANSVYTLGAIATTKDVWAARIQSSHAESGRFNL
jgi:hypothetical protein